MTIKIAMNKGRDSMAKIHKISEKNNTKNVMLQNSKSMAIEEPEHSRLLALLKTKSELKEFNKDIVAEVEARDKNYANTSEFNKNGMVRKEKHHAKVQKHTKLVSTSCYSSALLVSFL